MIKSFDRFYYNLKAFLIFSKEGLTEFGKEIAYENTVKIKYSTVALSLGAIFFVLKDIYAESNQLIALDAMHTIEKIANILLCSTIIFYFFLKCKNREEHYTYFRRNMLLVSLIVNVVLFTILIAGYTEIMHYSKESSFRIFVVCINFIVIINFQQRIIANVYLNLVYCLMLCLTDLSLELALVQWISFVGIQIVMIYLSHLQFKLWRSNYYSQSKLHFANVELEAFNEKLIKSESKLKIVNDELQNFVYTISHDLREPLRISSNFSTVLINDSKNFKTEREVTLLTQIRKNLGRMNTMLEDLLEFSRVGEIEYEEELVNLEQVIEIVLENLQDKIIETGAIIQYHSLPVIKANESEIISLFQNLISNAIKYRSEQTPIIRIESDSFFSFDIISIEDNGLGIQKEDKDKIFNIFYRAKMDNKIEGTGIGLALCQRIVEKMGGSIKVELNKQIGVKFLIHIPKN